MRAAPSVGSAGALQLQRSAGRLGVASACLARALNVPPPPPPPRGGGVPLASSGSTAAPEGLGKPEVAYAALLQPDEAAISEHLAELVQLTQDCAELAAPRAESKAAVCNNTSAVQLYFTLRLTALLQNTSTLQLYYRTALLYYRTPLHCSSQQPMPPPATRHSTCLLWAQEPTPAALVPKRGCSLTALHGLASSFPPRVGCRRRVAGPRSFLLGCSIAPLRRL